jgi:DNA mismatch repair protein MutL
MKPIIQLEQRLIDKIAAGEVVERPLSVVKELTENAIDAGAGQITVEIIDGGLTKIRVTDNGSGIPAGELPLAFARHATSKITRADDLFSITTLGFRGEALSSISAVSLVEMVTKTQGAVTGQRVEISGGRFVNQREVGCADGTTVIVSNLFFNVPARRKFLKKPSTEAGYIADFLQKLALGNPGLCLRYISNGTTVFQTNGNGDLRTVVLNVYGRDVVGKVIPVDAGVKPEDNQNNTNDIGDNQNGEHSMRLYGLLGKPEIARGNRSHGTFFINGRYIQSRLLHTAVESAFKTRLPSGKFPLFILNLNLPAFSLDVNVHPTKMDVRFADEEAVCTFIRQALEEALDDHNLIPKARIPRHREDEIKQLDQIIIHEKITAKPSSGEYHTLKTQPDLQEKRSLREDDLQTRDFNKSTEKVFFQKEQNDSIPSGLTPPGSFPSDSYPSDLTPSGSFPSDSYPPDSFPPDSTPPTHLPFFRHYTILGLIFNTYWLISQGDSLYLVDQHAAHERVLYEKILKSAAQSSVHTQPLLVPVPLRLTPRESQTLRDNEPHFNRLGFALTWGNEPSLTAVPFLFKGPVTSGFFMELLDKLAKDFTDNENIYTQKTELIAITACKAAVKGGDSLSQEEAHDLLKQLLQMDNPFTCPHGRPTIIEVSRRELERRFKRV